MFEELPDDAHLDLIIETPEVHDALKASADVITQGWEAKVYCTVPELINMMGIWKQKGAQTTVRELYEEHQDADCMRMRMAAIHEASQAMAYAISARENPTGFLA
jgi:aspartate/tyrosine/aromatic aminotransferase